VKEVCARLRQKHVLARQERKEHIIFEQLQLQLRQVNGEREKWQVICEAARRLDLAWISMQGIGKDGQVTTSIWREPGTPREYTRIIAVSLPIQDAISGRILELEIAVPVDGSLESANHKIGLFSRLLDESTAIAPRTSRAQGSAEKPAAAQRIAIG
jgi:hypothetical protein